MKELHRTLVHEVGRELIEKGLIVAAGFEGYKLMFRVTASEEDRARLAFFAGAQHLFASIMRNIGLDEGIEPTEADLRMDQIAHELKEFEAQMVRESLH